jgi:hypothetical protein
MIAWRRKLLSKEFDASATVKPSRRESTSSGPISPGSCAFFFAVDV